MKRIYILLVLLLLSACCWAQKSGRITYRVFSLNLMPDHSYEAVLDFDAKHSILPVRPTQGSLKRMHWNKRWRKAVKDLL